MKLKVLKVLNSSKLNIDFRNVLKSWKKCLDSYINGIELFAVKSPHYRGNTCQQESMC